MGQVSTYDSSYKSALSMIAVVLDRAIQRQTLTRQHRRKRPCLPLYSSDCPKTAPGHMAFLHVIFLDQLQLHAYDMFRDIIPTVRKDMWKPTLSFELYSVSSPFHPEYGLVQEPIRKCPSVNPQRMCHIVPPTHMI